MDHGWVSRIFITASSEFNIPSTQADPTHSNRHPLAEEGFKGQRRTKDQNQNVKNSESFHAVVLKEKNVEETVEEQKMFRRKQEGKTFSSQ